MKFRLINVRGDLFATALSFGAQAIVRLGSSLVLTRILNPSAYGVITVIMSVMFVIEMLADLGVTVFVIRDERGDDAAFINTAWTLRFGRAILNAGVLFVAAPFIADWIYHLPDLTAPLRTISICFVIGGLESMTFALAVRHQKSRILMYSELAGTLLATVFQITYCYFSNDFWGILYGIIINRLFMTVVSYGFFKDKRPKFAYDREAAKKIFNTTRYTVPSGVLLLLNAQFDKIIFLRLFDLRLLGIYGLAANIAGPIEVLIGRISQSVLYPRCAHNFRQDPVSFSRKYYSENIKLFIGLILLPAVVGGSASLIVSALYPTRYAFAAPILMAFMLRALLLALGNPAEDMLVAAGEVQVMLVGNICRTVWVFVASVAGYYAYGFIGFLYGVSLSNLTPLIYWFWSQHRKGFMVWRYELYKVIFALLIASISFAVSRLILANYPEIVIRR